MSACLLKNIRLVTNVNEWVVFFLLLSYAFLLIFLDARKLIFSKLLLHAIIFFISYKFWAALLSYVVHVCVQIENDIRDYRFSEIVLWTQHNDSTQFIRLLRIRNIPLICYIYIYSHVRIEKIQKTIRKKSHSF